jgi:hypothetical protein
VSHQRERFPSARSVDHPQRRAGKRHNAQMSRLGAPAHHPEENLPSSPLITVHLLSMNPGDERDVWGPKRQERKRRDHARDRINTVD